jgi:hypothetical protein
MSLKENKDKLIAKLIELVALLEKGKEANKQFLIDSGKVETPGDVATYDALKLAIAELQK